MIKCNHALGVERRCVDFNDLDMERMIRGFFAVDGKNTWAASQVSEFDIKIYDSCSR